MRMLDAQVVCVPFVQMLSLIAISRPLRLLLLVVVLVLVVLDSVSAAEASARTEEAGRRCVNALVEMCFWIASREFFAFRTIVPIFSPSKGLVGVGVSKLEQANRGIASSKLL